MRDNRNQNYSWIDGMVNFMIGFSLLVIGLSLLSAGVHLFWWIALIAGIVYLRKAYKRRMIRKQQEYLNRERARGNWWTDCSSAGRESQAEPRRPEEPKQSEEPKRPVEPGPVGSLQNLIDLASDGVIRGKLRGIEQTLRRINARVTEFPELMNDDTDRIKEFYIPEITQLLNYYENMKKVGGSNFDAGRFRDEFRATLEQFHTGIEDIWQKMLRDSSSEMFAELAALRRKMTVDGYDSRNV